jgi:2-oxoglutarate dehydrogenase E1 component
MGDLTDFYGPNAGYVLELYERYQRDPDSVDQATRELFEQWRRADGAALQVPPEAGLTQTAACYDVKKVVATARVARMVREIGHLTAHIDPLGTRPPGDPELNLSTHGLETRDLLELPASVVGGPLAEGAQNALEALGRLRRAYSGSIGYEDDHIQVHEERRWIVDAIESRRFFQGFEAPHRRAVLQRLTEVETFERFIHTTFQGDKRFSIEGTDMLVPMLDLIIHDAAVTGVCEVVMGMAHRGRLNVLAHILGKPYATILAEFQAKKQEQEASVSGSGTQGWTGDVKYHLGARRAYSDDGIEEMPVTLTPNPSHLEYVNPIVTGRARAAQELRNTSGLPVQDPSASLAILIHGDAAFPGQGIVAETLNLSQLRGYCVGGTIHIIVNNQIGFTTNPSDARSTLYASDLAKGFEIPIVHVNADDPEACVAAARMAFAYREQFGKDFLIDLVGYRRWGHNEGDEPSVTQPRMYEVIAAHPTVRELWATRLEREGTVSRDESAAMVAGVQKDLQDARAMPPEKIQKRAARVPDEHPEAIGTIETAVPEARLRALNEALLTRPEDFTPNARLERTVLARRRTAVDEPNGIVWAHAESLAFGSILEDGTPIRMTGQDSERGTFAQRHLVLHDPMTGGMFTPLQALPSAKASFTVYNSPLSENAVLGFEYGYSMHATEALVLWEAQFGDFINSAQVIVDQFLISGHAKWQQTPSLVLLLPHGYEGQGPEHSSARLERFLQLAANDNMRIVNCTTSAQYFHVLRRQAALLSLAPRPLIIFTPKSLLRHPRAASGLSDLATGSFRPVLDDGPAGATVEDEVTRLVLSTGKVHVDLTAHPEFAGTRRLATARVEELYPFPAEEIGRVLRRYPGLREVVWLQEEPRNMGAWNYVAPLLKELVPADIELIYAGRPESASPAEGSLRRHNIEQTRALDAALAAIPELKYTLETKSKRSKVIHAR